MIKILSKTTDFVTIKCIRQIKIKLAVTLVTHVVT